MDGEEGRNGLSWSEEWAEREEDPADIQGLLDLGYEQLDGFVNWLEEQVRLDTRTAQQDCFNAETLIDYLANYQRKSADQINEFELRWFLFSHYIRKAMADEETEGRLPDSLQRFFGYLHAEHGLNPPSWLSAVLDDRVFYEKRRHDYTALDAVDERRWEEGFRTWCAELEEDLDIRCLWLPKDLGNGMVWSDVMGWREATLHEEANRLWQDQRIQLLQQGLDYESVRRHLLDWYGEWSVTPQLRLDNRTPQEVVAEERLERTETSEEEEESDG